MNTNNKKVEEEEKICYIVTIQSQGNLQKRMALTCKKKYFFANFFGEKPKARKHKVFSSLALNSYKNSNYSEPRQFAKKCNYEGIEN